MLRSPIKKVDFIDISFRIEHLYCPLDIILLCKDGRTKAYIVHGATVTTVPAIPATVLVLLAYQLLLECAFDVAKLHLDISSLNIDVIPALVFDSLAVKIEFFVDFS